MEQIQINLIDIFIKILNNEDFKIEFQDENTGMMRAIVIEDIHIVPRSKRIQTKWKAYDVTPKGAYINPIEINPVVSSEADYDFFVQMFGSPIKKFAMNGLFRQSVERFNIASYAVYDEQGNLITEQPVPFPAPPPVEPNADGSLN